MEQQSKRRRTYALGIPLADAETFEQIEQRRKFESLRLAQESPMEMEAEVDEDGNPIPNTIHNEEELENP